MSMRLLTAIGALVFLAGCASSPPQAKTAQPPAQVVDGSGTDSERTTIQKSDSQIYQAEHAGDPDAPVVSPSQNQGIP
jgi:uncharacterized lipoprotein YajG